MREAYLREKEFWNEVFKDSVPVDLRQMNLTVEPMFDEALRLFSEKTEQVLVYRLEQNKTRTEKL